MKSILLHCSLVIALAGAWSVSPAFAAEEGAVKALPTLLIKGQVVSLDANDPTAILLKVKDRYGFETPIFLTQETQIAQGETTLTPTNLEAGADVEVEYNFDVNTAKRHAVSVKLPVAAPAAEAVPTPEATPAPEAASTEPTPTVEHPGAEHPGESMTPEVPGEVEVAPLEEEAVPAPPQ